MTDKTMCLITFLTPSAGFIIFWQVQACKSYCATACLQYMHLCVCVCDLAAG